MWEAALKAKGVLLTMVSKIHILVESEDYFAAAYSGRNSYIPLFIFIKIYLMFTNLVKMTKLVE